MITKEQKQMIQKIIDEYGKENEVDMCIEECSELQKALLKYRRKKKGEELPSDLGKLLFNIAEEIADVEITSQAMKMIYACETIVDEIIEQKLNRQLQERMKTANVGGNN